MSKPPTTPATITALYELLQEWFGIGSHDDVVGSEPWFRSRMHEVVKLKAQMTRRRASIEQVTVAAWYAREVHARIIYTSQLMKLIPEAQRHWDSIQKSMAAADATKDFEQVFAQMLDEGAQVQADRLYAADVPGRVALIAKWRASHA